MSGPSASVVSQKFAELAEAGARYMRVSRTRARFSTHRIPRSEIGTPVRKGCAMLVERNLGSGMSRESLSPHGRSWSPSFYTTPEARAYYVRDMPEHLKTYRPEQYRIFDVLPCLTDLASIRFFDLSSELESAGSPNNDPDELYLGKVHEERLRLRLEYVERKSFWFDASIVLRTLRRFAKRASANGR